MWILTTDDAAVDPPVVIRLATSAERTVGRANRSDFILDAALVSRVHCRLTTDSSGDLSVDTGAITERHSYEPSQAVPYPA